MIISIIVAIAQNGVIGNNNQLIWHIPEDLKYFKNLTMGHPIIMGRKTFESIGKPLPGRTNVILSRNKLINIEGIEIFHSVDDIIKRFSNEDEIFIIGGAEIYQLFIPIAHQIYVTRVYKNFIGDVSFPAINDKLWKMSEIDQKQISKKSQLEYQFFKYIRN